MVTGVVHTIKMALRRGEGGLFYSRINAACVMHPQQTAPVYSAEKHRVTPLSPFFSLLRSALSLPPHSPAIGNPMGSFLGSTVSRFNSSPSCASCHPSRDWEARVSRLTLEQLIMRQTRDRWMAREWFRDCQTARRRQIERFSRVSEGFFATTTGGGLALLLKCGSTFHYDFFVVL